MATALGPSHRASAIHFDVTIGKQMKIAQWQCLTDYAFGRLFPFLMYHLLIGFLWATCLLIMRNLFSVQNSVLCIYNTTSILEFGRQLYFRWGGTTSHTSCQLWHPHLASPQKDKKPQPQWLESFFGVWSLHYWAGKHWTRFDQYVALPEVPYSLQQLTVKLCYRAIELEI